MGNGSGDQLSQEGQPSNDRGRARLTVS